MNIEDAVFRAIANPARRAMLSMLAISDRSVGELTSEFAMSQPAVSQHLKELREAQLVSSERVGLEQRYRLTPKPLKHVMDWSAQYCRLIDPSGHGWSMVKTTRARNLEPRKREQTHGR